MSPDDIEAVLNSEILTQDTAIDSALNILNEPFDPEIHPLFLELKKISDEEEEINVMKVPNLSSKEDFAIIDKVDISDFYEKIPKPAIIHPFELDEFQKRAVLRLERRENVFVAAHTSAGKTVIAEYAIALCKQRMSRVFYTSPIKALSNQKYREFKNIFEEVGILTGDVSVDPDSFCVIMTTEILSSMLYNGSSKINDLEWVILDEVHYINDFERGVVWEEVLIMLPPHVKIVMLSATVPNYEDFSKWVGRIRQENVYVEITYERPVPLEHSVVTVGKFIPLIDMQGRLLKEEFEEKLSQVRREEEKQRSVKKYNKSEGERYKELVKVLREKELLPCVMFDFSRDKVDKRGEQIAQVSLLTPAEEFKVMKFAQRAIERLNPVDRNLRQILTVFSLLKQGVGVHHSGILPILKEIVEILFSKGLIKLLVATETFAMGLNMPTRSVVFCNVRKFDGNEHRALLAGEYTQMSGRAGRRGIDEKGNVFMFFEDPFHMPVFNSLKKITKDEPMSLESKFRIRYHEICNTLRSEELDITDLAKKSFLENAEYQKREKILREATTLKKKMSGLEIEFKNEDTQNVVKFVDELKNLKEMTKNSSFNKRNPEEGSIIEITHKNYCNLPGVVQQKLDKQVRCLLIDIEGVITEFPKSNKKHISYKIEFINSDEVISVHKTRIPKNKINKIKNQNPGEVELEFIIEFIKKVRAENETLSSSQIFQTPLNEARDNLVYEILNNPLLNHPKRHYFNLKIHELIELRNTIKESEECKTEEITKMKEDISKRLNLLKILEIVNQKEIVQLKGEVLGVIRNPYGLVIVESMFKGLYTPLTPEELVGVVSIFCNEDKADLEKNWRDISENLEYALFETAAEINRIQELEEDLEIWSETFEEKIKLSLVEVAYLWASGVNFVDITVKTKIREGNIVRSIISINDVLRNIHEAAIIMGNYELKEKSSVAMKLIERDIVFSTSLYISKE